MSNQIRRFAFFSSSSGKNLRLPLILFLCVVFLCLTQFNRKNSQLAPQTLEVRNSSPYPPATSVTKRVEVPPRHPVASLSPPPKVLPLLVEVRSEQSLPTLEDDLTPLQSASQSASIVPNKPLKKAKKSKVIKSPELLPIRTQAVPSKTPVVVTKERKKQDSAPSNRAAESFIERNEQWTRGVRLRQQWLSLGRDRFPVVALEIDPRAGVALRPIWSNPNGMQGTDPLVRLAPRWQAPAAINGGFFNRNNKLPLGALKRDGRWFSGPILYRGAIAWDDRGNFKISRLYLQETLTTTTGQRIPILYLNSGYVQAGVSRYTPEWGRTYTPLTDYETLVLVQNNRVTAQYPGGENDTRTYPIPPDGYLLTIRAKSVSASALAIDTPVQIESKTIPEDLGNYPQIIGAGPVLMQNRQIVLNALDEKFSAAFNRQAAPRSAIAKTNRGTLLAVTIHNRFSQTPDGLKEGKGPTLNELAQLMQRLGAVDALNLDGGSSTSLYLGGKLIDRDPQTAARVHNGIGIYPSGK
ncbi:phosphodiester glycosidase family protein [Lusitaniella coriacea LEGE 07157]|uniref:Phosphodiester glycosidase family protein n=1 Tax=Lusitaniella coriacea LEGE 07157 TaxID=945747 RepID=A0A8J7DZ17_9CYAN|nr:phosphodiester glycosidase family protein [Lusitaniella coriacea]MBE9118191.1 phosphodiester glycosidase family protein [Lusitaniella coriacea LEGE 07157]